VAMKYNDLYISKHPIKKKATIKPAKYVREVQKLEEKKHE